MLTSASPDARREARRHEIQVKACELVLEHGFAGFTMDELAAAVGCSRRTLFNYVPDKASAVIGPSDPASLLDASKHEEFLAGGPSGALFDDAITTITHMIRSAELPSSDLATKRLLAEAIRCDDRVADLVGRRLRAAVSLVEQAVCQREGWQAGDLRAKAFAATLLALVVASLDEFEHQEIDQLSDVFQQMVDAERAARQQRRPTG